MCFKVLIIFLYPFMIYLDKKMKIKFLFSQTDDDAECNETFNL